MSELEAVESLKKLNEISLVNNAVCFYSVSQKITGLLQLI